MQDANSDTGSAFDWNLISNLSLDGEFTGNRWLEKRLIGTAGHPNPTFARLGTISWMRALALLVEGEFEDNALRLKYGVVQRRSPIDEEADTAVFASVMMALQNLAALRALAESTNPAVIRPAIVSWYYGVYFAAGGMVAAKQGSVPDNHAKTADAWDACIVQRNLAHGPFGFRVSTLVEKEAHEEIQLMGGDTRFSLPQTPRNPAEALAAHLSYLKGTCSNAEDKVKARLLKGELKAMGLTDFRKKAARELRDARLSKGHVCFMDQAFRYRGKAHYRDALYFNYADTNTATTTQFLADMGATLAAFLKMASHLCSRCVERGTWDSFIGDLEVNTATRAVADAARVG